MQPISFFLKQIGNMLNLKIFFTITKFKIVLHLGLLSIFYYLFGIVHDMTCLDLFCKGQFVLNFSGGMPDSLSTF